MSLPHKTKQQKRDNDTLIRLMTPMIAGMLVCVFCLVSMTWAWFTASVHTTTQTIQSANRSTSVLVYEVNPSEGENSQMTKTLIKPETAEALSLGADTGAEEDGSVIIAGEAVVWELSPEKSYEVMMTGGGTATTGYCEVALSHTASGSNTPETKLYKTSAFEKENTVTFTYNTGGFPSESGVTATAWKEYVENTTPPTLTIASYWGAPESEEAAQGARMARGSAAEILLLSDGDVVGLAPIPCPEAKAETEVELEGFEIQEGATISAEEDYKVSLTLKEGYEMPSEVIVHIGGKDYVVSTGGEQPSTTAPYYDAASGILTVPAGLLEDGITVLVKAAATPIPAEEPQEPGEEETQEEPQEPDEEEKTEEMQEPGEGETPEEPEEEAKPGEETPAETKGETEEAEEAADSTEPEEMPPAKVVVGNTEVTNRPSKGKETENASPDEPQDAPAGDDGNGGEETDDNPSSDNSEEAEEEKADVTVKLSGVTINLEETKIPTHADLVLTLSAKEDMEFPEQIIIILDKTIRDEGEEGEEPEEDKTEYIIHTNGEDNPEGFTFDAESGALTIASELLAGVREITIADAVDGEEGEEEEQATITFAVTNLTFDFSDDKIVADEDVVITFTAGEGYELPETIVITMDGEEYIIYTSAEDSDKNPEGFTFDAETGTLTISKDLLKEVKAITITAEGIKKEEEDPVEEPEDKEDEPAGDGTADKDPEDETEEDNTETEGDDEGEDTKPEENPEDTTEGKDTESERNPEDTTENEETEPEGNPEDTTEGKDTEPEENPEDTTENEETEPETNPDGAQEGEDKAETPDVEETPADDNNGNDNGGADNTEGTLPESTESGKDDTEGDAVEEPQEPAASGEAPVVPAATVQEEKGTSGVKETEEAASPEKKETSSED